MKAKSRNELNNISPQQALEMLKEGNKRFFTNTPTEKNIKKQIQETSSSQFPYAVILSCIDSNVPTEIMFDQDIGDVFNIRIAGNIINDDILGSMEYACRVAGAKIIVVMGHTKCGAVSAACKRSRLGNISSVLEKITPSVNEIIGKGNSTMNPRLIDDVALENVFNSIDQIKIESPILADMERAGEIEIVGAMYDTDSGRTRFTEITYLENTGFIDNDFSEAS